jgi:ketosteroid isomerase-like protein
MKSVPIIMLVVAGAAFFACSKDEQHAVPPAVAASGASASASENVEDVIMQLEGEWGAALAKRDIAALDRILADDHSVITKDGSVLTKAQELANYGSGASSAELFDFEPVKVRIFGDTALATGGHREKSQYRGRNTSGHYRWTDVFVKRNGRWQAVASQLTRVVEGKP